ncbi:unnamed protein product (macronuclear) [Paramecium tetraurelia]|uniref:Uncharacterized protein n=1 Tax=Paramecium tetraurelia TaxID=5888 RepID=A0D0Z5_PARTE|nr:uncharacterized protein GSPATT00012264001 [Paramecium tetraurelia]CAK76712.1 unnamed protein product [Paramecium tetraurelia]|eukprot:XP_001444109.1 hypothetical protein (macronuclear) [Paramecium tetraurelia strain d4-2]
MHDEIEDHQNCVSIVVDTTIPTFAVNENFQSVNSSISLQPQLWYQLFSCYQITIKFFMNVIESAKLQSGKAKGFKKLKIGLENELLQFGFISILQQKERRIGNSGIIPIIIIKQRLGIINIRELLI